MSASKGSDRGILYPARLPDFRRVAPPPLLSPLVRWFWISEWDVEPGRSSRQHVVAFPASNLVVEHDTVGVSGPTTRASHKDLIGRGWAVAALLRPPAVPALLGDPGEVVNTFRTIPVDDPSVADLHRALTAVMARSSRPGDAGEVREGGEADRAGRYEAAVRVLGRWITAAVPAPHADSLLADRMAELADSRPDLTTVEALAAELGVSIRTAQRLSRRYIGVSPAALIRRRRLQEAAERIRCEPDAVLSAIAHDRGYADHAHLTKEFHSVLGFTPSAYRREALR